MTLDAHERRKLREMVEESDRLKRQVAKLNRAQDAGYTTIHGGRPIQWVDDDGQVIQRVGVDGVEVVGGEAPAQPAAPSVVSNSSNDITVTTDGDDVDDQPAPADWYRTKVYAAMQPDFEVAPANFKTSLWDVAGSTSLIVPAGTWFIRIVWETHSGCDSVPSDAVEIVVEPRVDAEDIQEVLDEAQDRINDAVESHGNRYGLDEPTEDAPDGVVYYQLKAADSDDVIGVFRRVAGEWVQMPLTDDVLVSVTTDKLVAGTALIGNTLIGPEAIETENLKVTQEMVGNLMSLLHLVVDRVELNELWGDSAWLAAIKSSSVELESLLNDWKTLLSGRGMEVISPEGQPSVQLGNFEETGLTLYQHDEVTGSNEATASMTDDGTISGTVISANESFLYQGTELSELIDFGGLPPVICAHHVRYVGGFHEQQVQERGFLEINFPVYPGRSYLISTNPVSVHSPTSRRVYLQLRHRDNASATLDSTYLARGATETNTSDIGQVQCSTIYHHPVGADEATKYVIASFWSDAPWMVSGGGGGLGDLHLYAQDLGPTIGNGYDRNIGKGRFDSGSDPTPDAPAPQPLKVRKVSTWSMDWWRTWWQNGNIPSSGVGTSEVVQGRTPYFTTAGLYRGMVGFAPMTSILSGADIEKIEVRVRVTHSHNAKGGRVYLGLHGNGSRPSSFSNYSNLELVNSWFGRGQEKWITLPSSTHAGFKNGTHRGVVAYSSSTSTDHYVQMSPSRFAVRITYKK